MSNGGCSGMDGHCGSRLRFRDVQSIDSGPIGMLHHAGPFQCDALMILRLKDYSFFGSAL
jgi:hypothetical protein